MAGALLSKEGYQANMQITDYISSVGKPEEVCCYKVDVALAALLLGRSLLTALE